MVRLPNHFRPGGSYKEFTPGLDLPSWFFYELRGIDRNFYFVFHPYKVMWDNIINQWEGPIEDPRFTIHYEYGHLNFGFVLKDRLGGPQADNTWHLWRWCYDAGGVAHILKIEDKDPQYLRLVLRRIALQARITDRYGFRAWGRKLGDEQDEANERMMKDRDALFQAVQEENSWLTKRAMENFGRGMTAPTRPTKDIIMSGKGITNKTKIQREITDKEGGLYVPENL